MAIPDLGVDEKRVQLAHAVVLDEWLRAEIAQACAGEDANGRLDRRHARYHDGDGVGDVGAYGTVNVASARQGEIGHQREPWRWLVEARPLDAVLVAS